KSDLKDGNGYISLLSFNGEIIEKIWIDGLNAPKGLAIHNDHLYVADIDRLIKIDLKLGKIVKVYEESQAVFLNDVAADRKGIIYVSDSRGNKLFRLKDEKFSLWLVDSSFKKVNGLFTRRKYLYVGSEKIQRVNTKTRSIKLLYENCGGIDGLIRIGNRRFLFSNWVGRISIIGKKQHTLLLDVEKDRINTADIDFDKTARVVYVPTFLDNRVAAYQLQ